MKKLNLIVVFDESAQKVLMCKRRKEPYKGLSNFVGGKIEPNEESLAAAYRELEEETAITRNDIILIHYMDLVYYVSGNFLEVYVGRLNKPVTVAGEENELYWSDLNQDFFDTSRYAGEGNIGHILKNLGSKRNELPL